MRRMIEEEWSCELSTKPKLAISQLLKENGGESQCLDVASKSRRQMSVERWDSPPYD